MHLVATALTLLTAATAAPVPLTRLTDSSARCLDGTLSGYYLRRATAPANASKWIIHLQGGGECVDANACTRATTSALGSSTYFADSLASLPFAMTVTAGNDFSSWNAAYVPYCSQDLHSGTVTSTSNATFGLFFSGHLVLRAVLDALDATAGLLSATDIILMGDSAGGIGVWLNVDWIAERYTAAAVLAAPIAGFYFYAYPYTGPNHTSSELADFREASWPHHYKLWSSFVDASCAQGLSATPWACMLANYSFPYISSRSFATEAQTDQVVLVDHDWVPEGDIRDAPERAYLTEWHANMTQALAPLADPSDTQHGIFNPACFIHTGFSTSGPLINGASYLTAMSRWYHTTVPASSYKLADDCGIMCNPTC